MHDKAYNKKKTETLMFINGSVQILANLTKNQNL